MAIIWHSPNDQMLSSRIDDKISRLKYKSFRLPELRKICLQREKGASMPKRARLPSRHIPSQKDPAVDHRIVNMAGQFRKKMARLKNQVPYIPHLLMYTNNSQSILESYISWQYQQHILSSTV